MEDFATLPNFGAHNKPNQTLHFDFPKREFGKRRSVKRVFQSRWFGKWQWLHYDYSRNLVFCHTCVTAFKTEKLRLSVGNVKDSAFLFMGFRNWKDTTVFFGSNEKSASHIRTLEGVITLPQTTRDVGDLLASALAAEKRKNRHCLITIAENIRFLARQGIALRVDTYNRVCNTNSHTLVHAP